MIEPFCDMRLETNKQIGLLIYVLSFSFISCEIWLWSIHICNHICLYGCIPMEVWGSASLWSFSLCCFAMKQSVKWWGQLSCPICPCSVVDHSAFLTLLTCLAILFELLLCACHHQICHMFPDRALRPNHSVYCMISLLPVLLLRHCTLIFPSCYIVMSSNPVAFLYSCRRTAATSLFKMSPACNIFLFPL
jgi:hypothetical protein